jgi:uncharacterized protein (DUF1697 family)
MTNHIVMLRGINVSGHKPVKMERLRSSLTALGFADVQTYIQSGNIVFAAPPDSAARLIAKIEQKILADFGFAVPVFLRTAKEMEKIAKQNPFLKVPEIDPTKLHVTFLAGDPPKTALGPLEPLAAPGEQLSVIGREIYLYCPHGYGDTKLSNATIERKLSVGATTRNWKTVNTLLAMAQ